jgi:small subunit ribosomal protein S2
MDKNNSSETTGASAPANLPISVKTLIEAGAHFGHQTTKWNPKMLPYIYGQRNGIHIINLDITLKAWERARKFIYETIASGGNILFVGTKQQAREIVKAESERSESFCVTSRWLGGTLSNFETIKNSIDRMRKLEDLLIKADDENSDVELHKKEKLMIRRQLDKLSANLGGIRNMRKVPDVIFVIDVNKEDIAVAEAEKLHIPVVALVDTNCDPDKIAYAIPSNDDANRTVKLFVSAVADLVIQARAEYKAKVPSQDNREASQSRNSNGTKVKKGAVEPVGEVEKTEAGETLSANQEAVAS